MHVSRIMEVNWKEHIQFRASESDGWKRGRLGWKKEIFPSECFVVVGGGWGLEDVVGFGQQRSHQGPHSPQTRHYQLKTSLIDIALRNPAASVKGWRDLGSEFEREEVCYRVAPVCNKDKYRDIILEADMSKSLNYSLNKSRTPGDASSCWIAESCDRRECVWVMWMLPHL